MSEKINLKLSEERILICVITYEEEPRIQNVLKRLPNVIWDNKIYHILLCDDNSSDKTISKAEQTFKSLCKNYNIVKLKLHQGYGGVQKICYRYAIDNNFDFTVLVHGDGQYAPELALKFVSSWSEKGSEIVLGSRMIKYRSAISGGMPMYKLVGNIILTKTQNLINKTKFSEFHTGYRGYATSFLKKVPFELNSNDFHFDTEILLQAFHSGAKVDEFLIPTFYGDEVSRVNGLRYALDVLKSSIKYRLQRLGLFVSLKYPHSANQVYKDKTLDPHSSHSWALKFISNNSNPEETTLLDIGCGPGDFCANYTNLVKESTGLDINIPIVSKFTHFIQLDLDKHNINIDIGEYDIVLMLDIIEHLSSPENFLINVRNSINSIKTPKTIISVPNIGFLLVRMNLLFGRFNYADRGILDITHKRFFTKKSFIRLLNETGFEVNDIRGIGVPFKLLGSSFIFNILGKISSIFAYFWPSLFAFQFIATVKPKPTTYQLIKNYLE